MSKVKRPFIVQMHSEAGLLWVDVMADPQGDAPMVFDSTAKAKAFVRKCGDPDVHYRVVCLCTPRMIVEVEQTERRTVKEIT